MMVMLPGFKELMNDIQAFPDVISSTIINVYPYYYYPLLKNNIIVTTNIVNAIIILINIIFYSLLSFTQKTFYFQEVLCYPQETTVLTPV